MVAGIDRIRGGIKSRRRLRTATARARGSTRTSHARTERPGPAAGTCAAAAGPCATRPRGPRNARATGWFGPAHSLPRRRMRHDTGEIRGRGRDARNRLQRLARVRFAKDTASLAPAPGISPVRAGGQRAGTRHAAWRPHPPHAPHAPGTYPGSTGGVVRPAYRPGNASTGRPVRASPPASALPVAAGVRAAARSPGTPRSRERDRRPCSTDRARGRWPAGRGRSARAVGGGGAGATKSQATSDKA
jgi:hypothetical protein